MKVPPQITRAIEAAIDSYNDDDQDWAEAEALAKKAIAVAKTTLAKRKPEEFSWILGFKAVSEMCETIEAWDLNVEWHRWGLAQGSRGSDEGAKVAAALAYNNHAWRQRTEDPELAARLAAEAINIAKPVTDSRDAADAAEATCAMAEINQYTLRDYDAAESWWLKHFEAAHKGILKDMVSYVYAENAEDYAQCARVLGHADAAGTFLDGMVTRARRDKFFEWRARLALARHHAVTGSADAVAEFDFVLKHLPKDEDRAGVSEERTLAGPVGRPLPAIAVNRWVLPAGVATPDFAASPLVVSVWALWSDKNEGIPEVRRMEEFARAHAASGLRAIALIAPDEYDSEEAILAALAALNPAIPVGIVDPAVRTALGTVNYPHGVLVGNNGKVYWSGYSGNIQPFIFKAALAQTK